MNPTLTYLLARKMWLVPGVVVWGEMANFEPEFVITESDGATKHILHGRFLLGGSVQSINFADLTDHRGNKLPPSINNACIVTIPHSPIGVVATSDPSHESFRLARMVPSSQSVTVDLLIVEMG
ncbi:MAG: hypothetical protein IPH59_07365 [bacterium]|nr:hypothetical protein [bacterium]